MARVDPATRKLLADLVAPVVEAHGGPTAVSKKVGRNKSSVSHWAKGGIDFDGLRALASGLRVDLVLTFPGHGAPSGDAKESPPAWAEGLIHEIRLNRAVIRAALDGVDPERAARVLRLLEDQLGPPALPLDEGASATSEATPEPQSAIERS